MSDKPSPTMLHILVGLMLAGSLVLIGCAIWLFASDRGAPVFVALAGSILAAFASIIASKIKKT